MYNFVLDDTQIEKFEKWKGEQKKKNSTMPTAGERWTFCFTPSGLGTIVHATDQETHDTIDLTDWDNF